VRVHWARRPRNAPAERASGVRRGGGEPHLCAELILAACARRAKATCLARLKRDAVANLVRAHVGAETDNRALCATAAVNSKAGG